MSRKITNFMSVHIMMIIETIHFLEICQSVWNCKFLLYCIAILTATIVGGSSPIINKPVQIVQNNNRIVTPLMLKNGQ